MSDNSAKKTALNSEKTHRDDICENLNPSFSAPIVPFFTLNGTILHKNKQPDPKNDPVRKRFVKQRTPYKKPTVIRTKGDWRVRYWYEYPDNKGKFKSFDVRDGINYFHDDDLPAKEKYAEKVRADIEYALVKDRFNPFEKAQRNKTAITETLTKIKNRKKTWSVQKAIPEFYDFIKTQGYTVTTQHSYKKHILVFEAWMIKNEFADTEIAQFTEINLNQFLNQTFKDKNWSTRTYNNYLKFMVTFFGHCKRLEKNDTGNRQLKYELDPDGLQLKRSVAQKNKAYTPMQIAAIKEETSKPGYENLRDYIEWIFYSLMRPDEIRNLQVEKIDIPSRQMRIIGKTGDRIVPISDQLYRLIQRRGVLNAKPKDYVFGWFGGVNNRLVGPRHFREKFQDVKEKLGLDGNYTLYGLKHSAIISMINSGIADEQIRLLSGHRTIEAFTVYKRDLILELGDKMKGSLIEF